MNRLAWTVSILQKGQWLMHQPEEYLSLAGRYGPQPKHRLVVRAIQKVESEKVGV